MKKLKLKLPILIGLVIASCVAITQIKAEEPAGRNISKEIVSDLTIGKTTLTDGEKFNWSITISAPENFEINPNDYIYIKLGPNKKIATITDSIYDKDPIYIAGIQVATAYNINGENDIKIVFNKNIKRLDNISGKLSFKGMARNFKDIGDQTDIVTISVGNIEKSINVISKTSGGYSPASISGMIYPRGRFQFWISVHPKNNVGKIADNVKFKFNLPEYVRDQDLKYIFIKRYGNNQASQIEYLNLSKLKEIKVKKSDRFFEITFPKKIFDCNDIDFIISAPIIENKEIYPISAITDYAIVDNSSSLPIPVIAAYNNKPLDLNFENDGYKQKLNGTLKSELLIENVSSDDGETSIDNAKFILKRKDGEEIKDGKKEIELTIKDAKAEIKKLPLGDYVIYQSSVPKWVEENPDNKAEFSLKPEDKHGAYLLFTNSPKKKTYTFKTEWIKNGEKIDPPVETDISYATRYTIADYLRGQKDIVYDAFIPNTEKEVNLAYIKNKSTSHSKLEDVDYIDANGDVYTMTTETSKDETKYIYTYNDKLKLISLNTKVYDTSGKRIYPDSKRNINITSGNKDELIYKNTKTSHAYSFVALSDDLIVKDLDATNGYTKIKDKFYKVSYKKVNDSVYNIIYEESKLKINEFKTDIIWYDEKGKIINPDSILTTYLRYDNTDIDTFLLGSNREEPIGPEKIKSFSITYVPENEFEKITAKLKDDDNGYISILKDKTGYTENDPIEDRIQKRFKVQYVKNAEGITIELREMPRLDVDITWYGLNKEIINPNIVETVELKKDDNTLESFELGSDKNGKIDGVNSEKTLSLFDTDIDSYFVKLKNEKDGILTIKDENNLRQFKIVYEKDNNKVSIKLYEINFEKFKIPETGGYKVLYLITGNACIISSVLISKRKKNI